MLTNLFILIGQIGHDYIILYKVKEKDEITTVKLQLITKFGETMIFFFFIPRSSYNSKMFYILMDAGKV